MKGLKDWLTISDSGALKNVVKRRQQRDATMLQLFGTPQEQERLRKEKLKKELERREKEKKK